jgi:hypothetical protein
VFIALIAVWQVRRRLQLLLASFLVVTSLLTPLYLCYRTYHDHGVFTASLLGRHVLRYHLVSVAEAMATGQTEAATLERSYQTDGELAAQSQAGGSVLDRLDRPSSFALELVGVTENLAVPLYNVQGKAIRDALKKYSGYLVLAYVKGFCTQLLWYPWASPFGSRVMAHLMRLAYWLFLALAAAATWEAGRRGNAAAVLVLWLSFLFWVAMASVAAVGGSRYRFPGDLLLIPLAAYGWMVLVAKFGSGTQPPIRHEREEFARVDQ